MLFTKCIFLPPLPEDGARYSVMSRHTLNDGKTDDPNITAASYDLWLPHLAPPDILVGSYYKRNLPWKEFEEGYLKHIRSPSVSIDVFELAHNALSQDITLLCVEETPEHCHRRLLAEECKLLIPKLVILVR